MGVTRQQQIGPRAAVRGLGNAHVHHPRGPVQQRDGALIRPNLRGAGGHVAAGLPHAHDGDGVRAVGHRADGAVDQPHAGAQHGQLQRVRAAVVVAGHRQLAQRRVEIGDGREERLTGGEFIRARAPVEPIQQRRGRVISAQQQQIRLQRLQPPEQPSNGSGRVCAAEIHIGDEQNPRAVKAGGEIGKRRLGVAHVHNARVQMQSQRARADQRQRSQSRDQSPAPPFSAGTGFLFCCHVPPEVFHVKQTAVSFQIPKDVKQV